MADTSSFETKILELIDKAEKAGDKVVPQAWDALVVGTQWDGALQLFIAFLLAVAAVCGFSLFRYGAKRESEFRKNHEDSFRTDGTADFCMGAGVCCIMVCTVFFLIALFSGNPVKAVFAPEAAIAQRLLLD